jgi:hypothetical protein
VKWPPAWELVVRQLPESRDVNMEAEEAMALKPLPGDNRYQDEAD